MPGSEDVTRPPMRTIVSILIFSAWVGVCSAAPEFIWQGAKITVAHAHVEELWAMAFTGLVLACFLEPWFERVRNRLHGAPPREEPSPTHALIIGFGLAVVAVCVHSAMGGFFRSGVGEAGSMGPGSAGALSLTLGSSLISSLVTLAWFARRRGIGLILASSLATVAPLVAGAILDWSRAVILTTEIPCLTILLLGHLRHEGRTASDLRLSQARIVAGVAAAWLATTLLTDLALDATGLKRWAPYSPGNYLIDLRFYAGWIAGLFLAPHPRLRD